jgi:hypothetical protein
LSGRGRGPEPGPREPLAGGDRQLERRHLSSGRSPLGASKKKAEGQTKSPFAECVVGQAKARKGKSPREACKDASKKHVKGEKKTSFATCVVGAKNVSADKKAQEESAPTES